jgi:hypothetical protein
VCCRAVNGFWSWGACSGRRGSSPEAAKRCASSRRALRATTVPVRMNVDADSVFLVESVLEFVANGAENAGHRGALSVARMMPRHGGLVVGILGLGCGRTT